MISHNSNCRLSSRPEGQARSGTQALSARAQVALGRRVRSAWSAGYGPLRGELHAAARFQGTRLHSRNLPLGSRARRLRRALLLSGACLAGDRLGRECADGGDRGANRSLCSVLAGARTAGARALRHQRDAQARRRGAGGAERELEASRRHHRPGRFCRPRSQISDLGTGTVCDRARGGHPKGARAQGRARLSDGGARRVRGTRMTTGGDGPRAVAGGPAPHVPVLGRPALELLNVLDGGLYIDATFGAGGYTRAMLAAADCRVIGIDRDPNALALGAELVAQSHGRLSLVEERFSQLDAVARAAGFAQVDGVVLDIGVSSMQLDSAERGFSFRLDGPLDMRMGGAGASAADVVAKASERDLANIIFLLGEERHSRAVARAIVRARTDAPFETTRALADTVASVVRSRPNDIHPATRTFQALRIFVNDELGELATALHAAERILKAGGRLVAVTFHSLEDRIVKSFLDRKSVV